LSQCPRISIPLLEFPSGAARFARIYSTFCNICSMARDSWFQVVTTPFMPALSHPGFHMMLLSRCASATGIGFSEPSWRWFRPRRSFGPLLLPSQPSPVKARNVLLVGKLYSNYSSRRDRSERRPSSWSWLRLSPMSPHHDELVIFLFPILPMFMQLALRTVRDNSFISCCPPSLLLQILQRIRFDIVLDQPDIPHTFD
jgi:hypothetical protein